MIKSIMKWARTPRPRTFQARRLEAIGSGAWYPSRKILEGCGVNKLPSHHYGSADQVFSWLGTEMQNRLRLPQIIVGKLPSGFYGMGEGDAAMAAPLGYHRICVFNESENLNERREILVFFHEAAHALNLLWHDRYFLAMNLMLNLRSGVDFSEDEVGFDYCTKNDFNFLSAADWAEGYANKNYQNDECALTLAINLLRIREADFRSRND